MNYEASFIPASFAVTAVRPLDNHPLQRTAAAGKLLAFERCGARPRPLNSLAFG